VSFNPLQKIRRWRKPRADDINKIIDQVNRLSNLTVRGDGAKVSRQRNGTTISIGGSSSGNTTSIAMVTASDTAGGFYTCKLQKIDATFWNSGSGDSDCIINDTDTTYAVLNLDEHQTINHDLAKSDLMACWPETDDEGATRYVGLPSVKHGECRRAITQEAAQGDLLISVKLTNSAGAATGDAFDATFVATDGATAASACLPAVASGKTILITFIGGTWYVVNPTLINSTVCS